MAESDVANYLKGLFTALGWNCREDGAGEELGGTNGNLIVHIPATAPNIPSIFFSAHMDTVEPTDRLKIIESEGIIRTDGSTILGADDKAGIAAAVEGLRAFLETGEPHGEVYLLISIAEEIGLKGAAELAIQDLGVDFGYVLDTGPPVGSFVTQTATHDKLDAEVIGVPAHAGKEPELGINAIQVAATAVSQMKIGRIDPETTANIGFISGGTAVNVVCPSVLLKGEARSLSVEKLDAQIDHMIQCFESAARTWKAEVKIHHKRHYRSYVLPADALVLKLGQQASEALGLPNHTRTTLGGSDANIYNDAGIPTVVMGTGMEKIHTHEEHIRVSDLILSAKLVSQVIWTVSQHQKA